MARICDDIAGAVGGTRLVRVGELSIEGIEDINTDFDRASQA